MKIFFIFVMFICNLSFSQNFETLKEMLEENSFNYIGYDHLDRVWIANFSTGKIIFLTKENQKILIDSIKEMDLICDLDLDWGEVFANFGGNNIYIYKDGKFKKRILTKDPVLGICWIKNEEIVFAVLGEDKKIKIIMHNIETDIQEELKNPISDVYERDVPYVYLRYNYEKKYLYVFDFSKMRLLILSMEKKIPILQFGMEIKSEPKKYNLVIKKELESSKGNYSYNFLLPKINFGIDKEGNFFMLDNCLRNKDVVIRKILLSKEMKKMETYALDNCPENVFYFEGSYIFYTLKNSKVIYLDYIKDN